MEGFPGLGAGLAPGSGLSLQAQQGLSRQTLWSRGRGAEMLRGSTLLNLGSRVKALLWAHLQSREPSLVTSGALQMAGCDGRAVPVGSGARHTCSSLAVPLGQETPLLGLVSSPTKERNNAHLKGQCRGGVRPSLVLSQQTVNRCQLLPRDRAGSERKRPRVCGDSRTLCGEVPGSLPSARHSLHCSLSHRAGGGGMEMVASA